MQYSHSKQGVTLIELLVSIAVLGLVLAGIYTLLNSAFKTYLNVRRRTESQQTAKVVTDYVVQRLREIDGGQTVDDPWNCTGCHRMNVAYLSNPYENATAGIPCPQDVTIPNPQLALLNLSTVPLPKLAQVPAEYQNMSGNYIRFQADLLPLHGFPESFTDQDGDGVWDWVALNPKHDINQNSRYDPGEPEVLEDMNENSEFDHFSEIWTLQVRPSTDGGPYYELVESVNFDSLQPRDISVTGKLKYNRSPYSDSGYSEQVVAYGLVGMSIKKVPRTWDASVKPAVLQSCGEIDFGNYSSPASGCHGIQGPSIGAKNIYGHHTSFSYTQFLQTHDWWDTRALSIEVSASSTTTFQEHFVKYKQFIIPRNMEINR